MASQFPKTPNAPKAAKGSTASEAESGAEAQPQPQSQSQPQPQTQTQTQSQAQSQAPSQAQEAPSSLKKHKPLIHRGPPSPHRSRRIAFNLSLREKLVQLREAYQNQNAKNPTDQELAPTEAETLVISRAQCVEWTRTRLEQWGRCIRHQRVAQDMTAEMLSDRAEVSVSTVRRAERGDPMVAASTYLILLAEVRLFSKLLPEPPWELQRTPPRDGRLYENHYPRSRYRKWMRRSVKF